MRALSELEGVCLGIISKEKLCTAYKVRTELKVAPSSHWRASAGSVYPLLARLESDGMVAASVDQGDGRGRKLLAITTSGTKALRAWIRSGADAAIISSVTDPVRSRTFFLHALSAQEQRECLAEMIVLLEQYLDDTQSRLKQTPKDTDVFAYLGSLGAMRIAAARLSWLREVRQALSC